MKKPSNIKYITAKITRLLFGSFQAITLFGVVYCKSKEKANKINELDGINSQLESHEGIHVRQAESTHNSWFLFYLKYIWQWICNLPLIFINSYAPYKFIAFELEAYRYQDYWDYCLGECVKWKEYNQLTLKQKRELAKKYYKNKFYFSEFIKVYVDPVLN